MKAPAAFGQWHRLRLALLLAAAPPSAAIAQEVAHDLLRAHQMVEAGEWSPALELLAGMQEAKASEVQLLEAAMRLDAVFGGLMSEGRFALALRAAEVSLVMRRRVFAGQDRLELAGSECNAAVCLAQMGRWAEALPRHEAALAMRQRLLGDRADGAIAASLGSVGSCELQLGRHSDALAHFGAELAMRERLGVAAARPDVARCHYHIAFCLAALDRCNEALPHFQASLRANEEVHGDRDHPEVALSLYGLAQCLLRLDRAVEATPVCEQLAAMNERLHADANHPQTERSRELLATCRAIVAETGADLRYFQDALAKARQAAGGGDTLDFAGALNTVGVCMEQQGRSGEALGYFEASLAMTQRLHGSRDHGDTMERLNNVASCLQSLGRLDEARERYEEALAMVRSLHGGADHWQVAGDLDNLGTCLVDLDRSEEALACFESALAMRRRLFPAGHESIAASLINISSLLCSKGRVADALEMAEEALDLVGQSHGSRDYPDGARAQFGVASCLAALGRHDEALSRHEAALAMRTRLFGELDHEEIANSLACIAGCLQSLGRNEDALRQWQRAIAMIERLRDGTRSAVAVRQSMFDRLKGGNAFESVVALAAALGRPAEAMQAAERSRSRELLDLLEEQRFDALAEAERKAQSRGDEAAAARVAALRKDLAATEAASARVLHASAGLDDEPSGEEREARRRTLVAEAKANDTRRRQLLDERARLVGDLLSPGRVRTPAECRASLREGDLLLEFTITTEVAWLCVLAHTGEVEALALPQASAALRQGLPALLRRASRAQVESTRGRDPDSGAAAAADDGVAASRELFDSLIPASLWPRLRAAKRVFVAAHRELHRLPFELLVTGSDGGRPIHWLENGPAISYVPSASVLHWLQQRASAVRGDATSLDFLAVGDPTTRSVEPPVPAAGDATRRGAVRDGDLERLRRLPPLQGARAETEAIESMFAAQRRPGRRLLGAEATETNVFDLAAQAKYLHFACHGIAEEYAGSSLSMLVLAQPRNVQAFDDGLLGLDDLFNRWRGRLSSCRLVVLSACRTNVGPTRRDDSPQALPIGFLFAGAPAVISSLWAVDDASTKELMTDFYGRLLAGETDQLLAFTAAKKALRSKYPDPFHWAPFLYIGAPE